MVPVSTVAAGSVNTPPEGMARKAMCQCAEPRYPLAKEKPMSTDHIFTLQLGLGYLAWWLCFRTYVWPRLQSMPRVDAHRAIAALHSFRFFGLVFVVPGVVGAQLPPSFASFAAYADLATGVLAMFALLSLSVRPLYWVAVVAFNAVGMADLVFDYVHAIRAGLPAMAGELGAAYAIPIVYVPLLMITHIAAFYMLMRPTTSGQNARNAAEPAAVVRAGNAALR